MKKTPRKIKSSLFQEDWFQDLEPDENLAFVSFLYDKRLMENGTLKYSSTLDHNWILPDVLETKLKIRPVIFIDNEMAETIELCEGDISTRQSLDVILGKTIYSGVEKLIQRGILYYCKDTNILSIKSKHLDYVIWEEGVEK